MITSITKLDFPGLRGWRENNEGASFSSVLAGVGQRLGTQEDDQIVEKRVGSVGRLSLETMEVAAEPTLQTDVLEKQMDTDDAFLKAQKHERELENNSYGPSSFIASSPRNACWLKLESRCILLVFKQLWRCKDKKFSLNPNPHPSLFLQQHDSSVWLCVIISP